MASIPDALSVVRRRARLIVWRLRGGTCGLRVRGKGKTWGTIAELRSRFWWQACYAAHDVQGPLGGQNRVLDQVLFAKRSGYSQGPRRQVLTLLRTYPGVGTNSDLTKHLLVPHICLAEGRKSLFALVQLLLKTHPLGDRVLDDIRHALLLVLPQGLDDRRVINLIKLG